MDKIIVYVDDADHAQQLLAPWQPGAASQRHWVLVACAPRMTHRVSKWVSHSARESWRNKWADKLFAQIIPGAGLRPSQVTTVLAKIPWRADRATAIANPAGLRPPCPGAGCTQARMGTEAQIGVNSSAERPSPPSSWPGVLGSVLTGCSTLWALALD
jgi:hypothetical protein